MGLLHIICHIISNCCHGDDNPALKEEVLLDLPGRAGGFHCNEQTSLVILMVSDVFKQHVSTGSCML